MQIIIRMCTDERSVTEYWHNINAQLDLDIYVLDHCDVESVAVMDNNNWLTYAEPLHRMREFGIMVPALNYLNYRQLTRTEIKSVLELLGGTDSSLLPNPETDWPAFVEAAKVCSQSLPMVYCPVRNEPQPWIDVEQVYTHISFLITTSDEPFILPPPSLSSSTYDLVVTAVRNGSGSSHD